MTDNKNTHENEPESLEMLDDSPTLTDSPTPSKWPWLIAAFIIILVVLLLQFGVRTGLSSLTSKTKPHASLHHQTTNGGGEAQALPMPVREKDSQIASVPETPRPTTDVVGYLQSQKRDEPDELARLRLLARLKEHEDKQKEQEAMIQSSAVINIGVGVQNRGALSGGAGKNGEEGYQNPNTQYLKSMSGQGVETVSATMLGDLRFLILKGKRIAGVTESAIDSDLPGIIRGHVTEDVYGAQGDIPLVHNGDELIGEYRSGDIRNGQVTLFVVWTRLRLQSGISVNLDSAGSDPLGRAGMTGNVDHHYMQRYGSALLMSTISAGAATVGVHGEDGYNSLSAFRQGASGAFSQTATQELQQGAAIQNSIRPPQGTEISILVNKDISFEDVLTQDENA